MLSFCCMPEYMGQSMQHKSQPSLWIRARLRHPIFIGIRGFASTIFNDTNNPISFAENCLQKATTNRRLNLIEDV
jgi:hypothetical protein